MKLVATHPDLQFHGGRTSDGRSGARPRFQALVRLAGKAQGERLNKSSLARVVPPNYDVESRRKLYALRVPETLVVAHAKLCDVHGPPHYGLPVSQQAASSQISPIVVIAIRQHV